MSNQSFDSNSSTTSGSGEAILPIAQQLARQAYLSTIQNQKAALLEVSGLEETLEAASPIPDAPAVPEAAKSTAPRGNKMDAFFEKMAAEELAAEAPQTDVPKSDIPDESMVPEHAQSAADEEIASHEDISGAPYLSPLTPQETSSRPTGAAGLTAGLAAAGVESWRQHLADGPAVTNEDAVTPEVSSIPEPLPITPASLPPIPEIKPAFPSHNFDLEAARLEEVSGPVFSQEFDEKTLSPEERLTNRLRRESLLPAEAPAPVAPLPVQQEEPQPVEDHLDLAPEAPAMVAPHAPEVEHDSSHEAPAADLFVAIPQLPLPPETTQQPAIDADRNRDEAPQPIQLEQGNSSLEQSLTTKDSPTSYAPPAIAQTNSPQPMPGPIASTEPTVDPRILEAERLEQEFREAQEQESSEAERVERQRFELERIAAVKMQVAQQDLRQRELQQIDEQAEAERSTAKDQAAAKDQDAAKDRAAAIEQAERVKQTLAQGNQVVFENEQAQNSLVPPAFAPAPVADAHPNDAHTPPQAVVPGNVEVPNPQEFDLQETLQPVPPQSAPAQQPAIAHVVQSAPDSTGVGRPTVERRFQSELFYSCMLEHLSDGVIFVDHQKRVKMWSRGAEKVTGIVPSVVLERPLFPQTINLCDTEDQNIEADACPIAKCIRNIEIVSAEYKIANNKFPGGVKVELTAIPVVDSNRYVNGAVVMFHDRTAQVNLQRQLKDLYEFSVLDPLTQVANRAEFERVQQEYVLAFQQSDDFNCSIIICDIDFFKSINDKFGHAVGDEALVAFAKMLKKYVRAQDLVARYGGEEFVILCADCDTHSAVQRAEQIRMALYETRQPMLEGKAMSASFGVSELREGDTAMDFFIRADTALLKAKEMGRNRVVAGDGSGALGADDQGFELSVSGIKWKAQQRENTALICEEFKTATPIQVLVEKLRGFIIENDATLQRVEPEFLSMEVEAEDPQDYSRKGVFTLHVEFKETEMNIPETNRTKKLNYIRVTIYAGRMRKWFSTNHTDLAPHLLGELRRFLMIGDEASRVSIDMATENVR